MKQNALFILITKQQGRINTGMLYIMIILFMLIGISYVATGPTPTQSPLGIGTEVAINNAAQKNAQSNLQLLSFTGAVITPPAGSICRRGGVNNRPEIILAYSPAHGKAVRSDGQIKVWAQDNKPLFIAPNERIGRNSGAIVKPGDRTLTAPDGLIWEPQLYVFPQTVDNNGKPYFPNNIKGHYNNGEVRVAYGMEKLPPGVIAKDKYVAQYTWNVKDVGLVPGAYQLQFVIHDGGQGRAIGCIAIRVFEPPDPRWVIPDDPNY